MNATDAHCPSSLARLAGAVLEGKRDLAELDTDAQRTLLAFLLHGKCVLFRADPEQLDGPSLLRIPALETQVLADALAGERQRCDAQRRAFLEAQEQLAAVDIPLLLFKTTGPYPYTSSNVDALVPMGQLDRAAATLAAGGYHEMTHYWEPNKRLLRRFRGRQCELVLHLHEKISWLVLAFSDMEALWTRARRSVDPRVLHPAPEHVVAALLAHSVYESNQVSAGDVEKVRSAVGSEDFAWDEVLRIAHERAWCPGLALSRLWYATAERSLYGDARLDEDRCCADLPAVPRGAARAVEEAHADGSWPLRLDKRRTKPFFFRKLLLDNRRGPGQKLWDLVGVALQLLGRFGLRRRPAALIALCGIDGSGKSSHAEAVRLALAECELPTSTVWMRGGYAPLSELLKRVLRRSERIPGSDDSTAKEELFSGGGLRWLWAWWVVIEQIGAAIGQVRFPRWLGRTAVAERFVPDTLCDLSERYGDPDFQARLPARLLRAATPRANLILLLDLPGPVAYARKPDDWSAEVLERRRALYRELVAGQPEVCTLDAERPQEELEAEVVRRVLDTILARIALRNPLAKLPRDAWE